MVRPPWTKKSCNFWEVRIYPKKKNMPQPMTWYVRGHRVYEKHVEVSFPWGKINHSQNECWNIVWFVHTYYSSIWQDCVGIAKSSVKCSRKTKKWRMFKSYIIAYICICAVVPKISGMLPWKCWGMRQKNFTLEKFFDFFFRTRIYFWLIFDFSLTFLNQRLTFYRLFTYIYNMNIRYFLDFLERFYE